MVDVLRVATGAVDHLETEDSLSVILTECMQIFVANNDLSRVSNCIQLAPDTTESLSRRFIILRSYS